MLAAGLVLASAAAVAAVAGAVAGIPASMAFVLGAVLARLYDNGTISQPTRQHLQRSLDLEAARLGHDQH